MRGSSLANPAVRRVNLHDDLPACTTKPTSIAMTQRQRWGAFRRRPSATQSPRFWKEVASVMGWPSCTSRLWQRREAQPGPWSVPALKRVSAAGVAWLAPSKPQFPAAIGLSAVPRSTVLSPGGAINTGLFSTGKTGDHPQGDTRRSIQHPNFGELVARPWAWPSGEKVRRVMHKADEVSTREPP